jgi:hypothetical protein
VSTSSARVSRKAIDAEYARVFKVVHAHQQKQIQAKIKYMWWESKYKAALRAIDDEDNPDDDTLERQAYLDTFLKMRPRPTIPGPIPEEYRMAELAELKAKIHHGLIEAED